MGLVSPGCFASERPGGTSRRVNTVRAQAAVVQAAMVQAAMVVQGAMVVWCKELWWCGARSYGGSNFEFGGRNIQSNGALAIMA